MKIFKYKWLKVLVIILLILTGLVGGGYLYIQMKIAEIKGTLSGCDLENKNFDSTINFDYISHWIVIKGKINGSEKEYDFILDTGAQTVFSDSLFKELRAENYKKIKIKTDTSKHAFRDEVVSLDKLELGEVTFSDVGALVVDNSEYKMLNCISPYGIIGYNILQTCCFQIDYEKRQIKITDQLESLDNLKDIQWIKYTTLSQETPIIPAILNNNINVNLLFDTGYSGAVKLSSKELYKTIKEKYSEQTALFTTKPTITIAGGKDVNSYQSMLFKTSTFSLGIEVTENLIISVSDLQEKKYSGLIGNKYFENYVITLNYQNKRVGFLPNEEINKPGKRTTFGLNYTPLDNKLIVTTVYKNADAEKKGINVGDEIISINGIKISELPEETFCEIFRGEYDLITKNDKTIILEIITNGTVVKCELEKYQIFY